MAKELSHTRDRKNDDAKFCNFDAKKKKSHAERKEGSKNCCMLRNQRVRGDDFI